MFTQNSRIIDILKEPELTGRKYMVSVTDEQREDIFANMPFKELHNICGWDPVSITEGMEYLYEQMKQKNIFYDFWTEKEKHKEPSRVKTALAAFTTGKKSKYAIICAGGGYQTVCTPVEAYPLAKRLNKAGYTAFVVVYRVGENGLMPNPIDDLAEAVRFITDHAEEFKIETKDYAVIGSSAGGHLAAIFGTDSMGYKKYNLVKPGSIFLAYPVISYVQSSDHKTIKEMRRISLGENKMDIPELKEKYSVEYQITESYPPTFIWQCEEDTVSPFVNSKVMVQALSEHKISYIYEIYKGSAHGWGIADRTPAEGWLDRAIEFWQKNSQRGE